MHPRVASALNEAGRVAMKKGDLDEAETDFRRAADIYRTVYNGKHYYIGVALANLGGVYNDRKDYANAELYFRQALAVYAATLPAEHQQVGIVRIRMGRSLLLQKKYKEAEAESRGGYEILMKQPTPPAGFVENARKDLVEEYAALHEPEKAAAYRLEAKKE
jgi:tetratricopeptide (TPR) repeat protein